MKAKDQRAPSLYRLANRLWPFKLHLDKKNGPVRITYFLKRKYDNSVSFSPILDGFGVGSDTRGLSQVVEQGGFPTAGHSLHGNGLVERYFCHFVGHFSQNMLVYDELAGFLASYVLTYTVVTIQVPL